MPPYPSQKNSAKEASEVRESGLNLVIGKSRMTQVRQEIGIIADRSFRNNLIGEEAYEGYRELAEGREEHEISADMLESSRKFAKEHEEKAIRIHQKIKAAISAGIASENDEEFLMETLIAENTEFVSQAGEIEGLVTEKLARMKKDREKYDKFAAHKLIKEEGCLTVDASTTIDFPDAEEFLELTVPERRELLKQLEDALPKAEKYAEENEADEEEELIAEYEEKLDEKLEEGVIGKHTYNAFLSEFKKINRKEKIRWNKDSEFSAQMKRYEVLWDQIRDTLQGPALEGIEGKIDSSGYSELLSEFGRLKQSETQRLHTGYAAELAKYQQEGVIGRHTVAEFRMWMVQQDMASKYSAEEELPEQMARYEELWENIEELDEKQQDFLKSKIDSWGYTELDAQYKVFKGEVPANDGSDSKALSQLRSTEMKDAIMETDEMLEEQGETKKKAFVGILNKMFATVNRDSFDATSFEAQLREKAAAHNPTVEKNTKARAADDEVDFYEIGKNTELLEETGKAEVKDELGFVQVETEGTDGTARQAQVTINEEEGLEHLFGEQGKRGFSGKKDDLSLAIWTTSGRTVEMDLQEIRALHAYLKESETEEKKAA